MGQLHTLALGKNNLSSVPSNLGKMAELRELDLFMNKLRALPISEPAPPKLHSLMLRANRLAEVSETWLGLTALTYLDISSNKVESLAALANMARLTKLECSSCRLANLSLFADAESPLCKSISVINVSGNRQITRLSDFQTPNLTELRAMRCSIEHLASALEGCVKLKILDLDQNPLRSLLLRSPRLEVLAICGSKLHHFPVVEAGSLIEFASAHSMLRRLPAMASEASSHIKRLYLQHNGLSELGAGYLNSLLVET